MATLMEARILLRKIKDLRCLTLRRNRMKGKWATSLPKYPATNMALQNFDATYSLQLGQQWPSVRASLLSERKYGALVNNFSAHETVMADLQDKGCTDFVSQAVKEAEPLDGDDASRELASLRLSPNVKCLVFPRGDITRFKPARPDAYGLLGYYLMDAASILPCLALDVQDGHSVLDLCAAPGGKTLALLQSHSIRFLCVNDSSISRTTRLKKVLSSYVPQELRGAERLRVSSFDGTKWGEVEKDTFHRVLVDVPCTTDRHSVLEEDNNIFQKSRSQERRSLPRLQVELLLAGVMAACPGGDIVYSTCSLSQLQNQYVVEQAVRLAREEHGIHLQVVDLRPLTHLFRNTFNFATDLHLGEMVVPHLVANFGPIYMCKLRRLT